MKFIWFRVIFIGVCFTFFMAFLLGLDFILDVVTPIFALSPLIYIFVRYFYGKYSERKLAKDDTTKTVRINDKYSIDLPSFTEPVPVSVFASILYYNSFFDGDARSASLRYHNRVVNFYTYVIDRAKSDVVAEIEKMKTTGKAPNQDNPLLVDYAEMALKRLHGFTLKREDTDINVGGLKGITISLLKSGKHKHYYRVSFLEGKDTIYQIVSLKVGSYGFVVDDPFLFKMLKIVNSFREL